MSQPGTFSNYPIPTYPVNNTVTESKYNESSLPVQVELPEVVGPWKALWVTKLDEVSWRRELSDSQVLISIDLWWAPEEVLPETVGTITLDFSKMLKEGTMAIMNKRYDFSSNKRMLHFYSEVVGTCFSYFKIPTLTISWEVQAKGKLFSVWYNLAIRTDTMRASYPYNSGGR